MYMYVLACCGTVRTLYGALRRRAVECAHARSRTVGTAAAAFAGSCRRCWRRTAAEPRGKAAPCGRGLVELVELLAVSGGGPVPSSTHRLFNRISLPDHTSWVPAPIGSCTGLARFAAKGGRLSVPFPAQLAWPEWDSACLLEAMAEPTGPFCRAHPRSHLPLAVWESHRSVPSGEVPEACYGGGHKTPS